MTTNLEFFEEELNTGVGWGRVRLRLGLGPLTTNLKFFEEDLNTGVGWGRGQIKVGVGVTDNLF